MDLFADPADQNPNAFLDLTNVLPSLGGGFKRRWGIASVLTNAAGTAINPVRAFSYNVSQDQTDASSTALSAVLFTDGTGMQAITDTGSTFTTSTLSIPFPSGGSASGSSAVTSREFLYITNGAGSIVRVGTHNFAYVTPSPVIKGQLNVASPTFTSWGFAAPILSGTRLRNSTPVVYAGFSLAGYGTGSGYVGPTVTISDPTGTGAVVTAQLSNGHISGFSIQASGTNYTAPTVTITDASGSGAKAIAYADLNPNSTSHGQIVAVVPAGPISLAGGRKYTAAFVNSITGHVSDISTTSIVTPANQALTIGKDVILSAAPNTLTPGWTAIDVTLTFGSPYYAILSGAQLLDPQIDTVLLLATSDGGSLEDLYEAQSISLGSFTHNTGHDTVGGIIYNYNYYTTTVTDTLPDTFSTMYTIGSTLLTNNIYASTDGVGNEFGIIGNTPPPTPLLYPTVHLGRIFGTDGETVYFSKSIDEVTTASGLITSKWEEAWPGDNQLPIALSNERITALKSDGYSLHIGTTKAIYTCTGSDPSDFSVATNQFAQTGVLSNDLWTVVYAQGEPAGFMWVTPDLKIMWSDFNTYTDIGTPVYPLLQQWDSTFTNTAKLLSFTQGPYNFAVLCYKRTGQAAAEFLVYETILKKWYRWSFGSPSNFLQPQETGPLCSFVYQHPSTGNRYLYFFTLNSGVTQASRIYEAPPTVPGGYTLNLYRFDPTLLADLGSTGIGWNVQTAWQDMGDDQVIKVLNEIDAYSDESNLQATIYGAFTQADLDSPYTISSGNFVTGILGNLKYPLASTASKARFYSFRFFSNNPSTTLNQVLGGFTTEHCVLSRI